MNEPTVKKEELRKEFIELWEGRAIDPEKTWIDNIFDFFWKHLEAIQQENRELGSALITRDGNLTSKLLMKKLHDKEELIKELQSALVTRDGNLTSKVLMEKVKVLEAEVKRLENWHSDKQVEINAEALSVAVAEAEQDFRIDFQGKYDDLKVENYDLQYEFARFKNSLIQRLNEANGSWSAGQVIDLINQTLKSKQTPTSTQGD